MHAPCVLQNFSTTLWLQCLGWKSLSFNVFKVLSNDQVKWVRPLRAFFNYAGRYASGAFRRFTRDEVYHWSETDRRGSRGKTRAWHGVTTGFHVVVVVDETSLLASQVHAIKERLTAHGLTRHLANLMVFALAVSVLGRACPRIHGYLLTVFLTMAADTTPAGRSWWIIVLPCRRSGYLANESRGIYCPQPRIIRNRGSLQRDVLPASG